MSEPDAAENQVDQRLPAELSEDEIDAVAGGVIPLLALTVGAMALGFAIGAAWKKADK